MCNAAAQNAIGVFDSGLGGLTAVRELRRILPGEDIVYFGDTGRVPYGTRGRDIIVEYAKQDIAFLLSKGASLPVPYMGVVESAARAAVLATKTGRIGVIGTPATVASGSYPAAIRRLMPGAAITATACPLFVPLVENGYFGVQNPVTRLVAQDYLKDVKSAGVDTLILGCTHYPLIAPVLADLMGPGVTLVDVGRAAAQSARHMLERTGLLRAPRQGKVEYYVSDSTEQFDRLAHIFLGEYAGGSVQRIDIDAYGLSERRKVSLP